MKSLEEKGVRGEKILTKKDRSERNQEKKEVVGNRPRVQNIRTIRPKETDLAGKLFEEKYREEKTHGENIERKNQGGKYLSPFAYL